MGRAFGKLARRKNAATQAEHAAAAREIEQKLAADPLGFGESRYDAVRVGFVRPRGDVRTVIVYDVWRINVKRS